MINDAELYRAVVGLWVYLVLAICIVFFAVTRDWRL